MPKTLIALATAFVLSASAQAASSRNPETAHPPRTAKSHGVWETKARSHDADCPNGDCRGLNSPGNMGGHHEF